MSHSALGEEDQQSNPYQRPDSYREQHTIQRPFEAQVEDRMEDSHITLQADAGQEKGAAEHVGQEEGIGGLAQAFSKGPVIVPGMIHCL